MIFTLKILRFFLRLTLKAVLFPFRLVRRLVGMVMSRSGSDAEPEPVEPADVENTPATEGAAAGTELETEAGSEQATPGTAPATADEAVPAAGAAAGVSAATDTEPADTETDPGSESSDATGEGSGGGGPDGPSDETTEVADEADGSDGEAGEADQDPTEPGDDQPADLLATHRESLTADDPTTRADAVRALVDGAESGRLPTERVVEVVGDRLANDEAEPVRVAACEALGRLEDERARSLVASRRLDPNDRVSHAATEALRGAT